MKKGDEVVNGYFFSKGEVFVLFTLVLCLGVAVTLLVDDYVRPRPGLLVVDEERVLYDLEGVNGFYSYIGYFCVRTADRLPEEVAQTTFHELAHYYVHVDPSHFVDFGGGG